MKRLNHDEQILVDHFLNHAWPLRFDELGRVDLDKVQAVLSKHDLTLIIKPKRMHFDKGTHYCLTTINDKVYMNNKGELYVAEESRRLFDEFIGYL